MAEQTGGEIRAARHAVLLARFATACAAIGIAQTLGILLIGSRGDVRFRLGADLATMARTMLARSPSSRGCSAW
jgi:hypothetical protein